MTDRRLLRLPPATVAGLRRVDAHQTLAAAWGLVLARRAGEPRAVVTVDAAPLLVDAASNRPVSAWLRDLARVSGTTVGTEDGTIALHFENPHTIVANFKEDADAVEAMLAQRGTALAALVTAADRPVRRISTLSTAQRSTVLYGWNATRYPLPDDPCLHALVAAQVRRVPDRPAVSFDAEQLTYAELDAAANTLAHRLRALGVGPDVVVGLAADRSLEYVVAILAVLKAGGAFAPLDATGDRLAYLVDDLRCPVILADAPGLDRLPPVAARVVPLAGATRPAEPARPEAPPEPGVLPTNLAYVFSTSGSTGRPKGVLVTHEGATNFVRWIADRFPLAPGTAVLQWTPVGFDPSVWELFWPLLLGERAVLAPPGAHADPAGVADLIARERVATLHFTPATLAAFLTVDGIEHCTALRYLFCSGEPVPAALVARAAQRTPAPVVNLYGATEVSVDSTYEVCAAAPAGDHVAAGRPIDNTAVYVLDGDLEPAPVGGRGEVFLAGTSVARGYLGRPALTAERFLPDPYGPPGSRMYRTGDLGRWTEGGDLEVFGRRDGQVKVRGVRIELGEIEAVALEHPAVSACAARVDGEGLAKRVVAYVVARGPLDLAALRDLLRRRLPGPAVPAAIAVLPALPLSPTGKVDRAALPPIQVTPDDRTAPPRTETERSIARIWAGVLGVPHVGVHDDFVGLGGDSLLASQVLGLVQAEFGVRLSLPAWLSAGTVAELATVVEQSIVDAVARLSDAEVRATLDRLG